MHFNVDENRVYLAGDSDGGRGTFATLESEATFFAAAVSVIGAPGGVRRFGNLLNVPIFAINGAKDTLFKIDKVRESMEAIPPPELHERSVAACSRLTQTREYAKAEIIMVFLSLPNEVDTTSLVLHAWRDRKRVLAPKVSWEQRRMLPIQICSLSDDVSESPLGIREPAQGVPIPVGNIDVVIVPGIGLSTMAYSTERYDR